MSDIMLVIVIFQSNILSFSSHSIVKKLSIIVFISFNRISTVFLQNFC